MIHLFDNVYLDIDSRITEHNKKVIISEVYIKYLVNDLKTDMDTVIDYATDIESLIAKHGSLNKFFKVLPNNEPVIIFANKENYLTLLVSYLKSILPNISVNTLFDLVNSLLFRDNVFNTSRFSLNREPNDIYFDLSKNEFAYIYKHALVEDLDNLKNKSSVEYLLCSYLHDGSYKEQLKESIKVLLRQDLVKYLFELKEIFLVHLRTNPFIEKYKLSKKYDFNNFTEIVDDDSEFPKLFMNPEIWKTPYRSSAISIDDVIPEKFTDENIESLKRFTVMAGDTWNEEGCYIFMKSDVNKLDFIPCLSEFTDEMLDKLIEAESTFNHSSGSFFSIDLATVNHYFIQTLLENKNNKEFLKNYRL